jgi:diguanylate cyclase (GGDEF)-like protein
MSNLLSDHLGLKLNPKTFFAIYLTLVSSAGGLLVGWSLWQILFYEAKLLFLLFLCFAGVAAVLTTSMPMPSGSGITYHISAVIGIATVPLFGASAAIIVVALQGLCTWLIKPAHTKTWKKSWSQLSFNVGMDVLAICMASLSLALLRTKLDAFVFLQATVPWLVAALVYNEVNLWLLIGILRLQHGSTIHPLLIWREEHWSTQIDVLLMTVGGALLAFAASHYGWLGLTVFFVPIALSAYAFRLYVQQMQAHLDNLDQIVNERTASLQRALAQLQVEMGERQRAEAELRRLATYDPLTHALNRRAFLEGAEQHFMDAKRTNSNLAVLMFDLDRFKQVNDCYGHAAGDVALQYFAQLCMTTVSETHLFGRLGGEEFAMLLPQMDGASALAIGERIRISAPATTLTVGQVNFTVMVSIGLALVTPADLRFAQVLERADQQLYLAKRQGGNCVLSDANYP